MSAEPIGHREYKYSAPGMAEALRVTTDADYFEQHASSVELWSPGSPLFPDGEGSSARAVAPGHLRDVVTPR
ncbi:MAG: hypothetical protein IT179_06355 [Acidobacteria bacterium]|nr:hypothetical protein [Acidobacteriota bacterium]